MRATQPETTRFSTPMRLTLIVGLAAAVVSVIGLFLSGPSLFFQAYLYAFLFWLGLSLGSFGLLLTHLVLPTKWGLTIRRITEAASGSIWIMAILFIPLLFGLSSLYPWVTGTAATTEPEQAMMAAKAWYLNIPFFIIRAVIYFALWIGMAFYTNRRSAQIAQVPVEDNERRGAMRGPSAFFLIIYFVTMFFAGVDWIMSLQPLWSSTAFGLIIVIGQALSALAFAILILNLFPSLSLGKVWSYLKTPVPYKDLGALLLVFVIGWAYLSFFQLLIIWAGNIPREVIWYATRVSDGWNIVSIFIAVFQFALPFLILLTIRVRHNLRTLVILAVMLLFSYLVTQFWHVKPAFSPTFSLSWLDIVLPIAIGGIWLGVFFFNLARRPALSTDERVALKLTGQEDPAIP